MDKTLNLNLVVSIKPAALYNSARNYFDSAQPIDTPSFENVLPRKEIRKHKVMNFALFILDYQPVWQGDREKMDDLHFISIEFLSPHPLQLPITTELQGLPSTFPPSP